MDNHPTPQNRSTVVRCWDGLPTIIVRKVLGAISETAPAAMTPAPALAPIARASPKSQGSQEQSESAHALHATVSMAEWRCSMFDTASFSWFRTPLRTCISNNSPSSKLPNGQISQHRLQL